MKQTDHSLARDIEWRLNDISFFVERFSRNCGGDFMFLSMWGALICYDFLFLLFHWVLFFFFVMTMFVVMVMMFRQGFLFFFLMMLVFVFLFLLGSQFIRLFNDIIHIGSYETVLRMCNQ